MGKKGKTCTYILQLSYHFNFILNNSVHFLVMLILMDTWLQETSTIYEEVQWGLYEHDNHLSTETEIELHTLCERPIFIFPTCSEDFYFTFFCVFIWIWFLALYISIIVWVLWMSNAKFFHHYKTLAHASFCICFSFHFIIYWYFLGLVYYMNI